MALRSANPPSDHSPDPARPAVNPAAPLGAKPARATSAATHPASGSSSQHQESAHRHSPNHSPDHTHSHVHSPESLRKIVNRLSRIEGHVRGVKSMVQDSRSCPDVLIQLAAIRAAIDRVARAILDEHLSECIARAASQGNIEAEIEDLKEALDRFLT